MTNYVGTPPFAVDLLTYRGDTWTQELRFLAGTEPVDLTGVTLAASCRTIVGEHYPMAVEIVGEPTDGTIALSIADWAEIPAGDHSYDVEATSEAGTVTTWVRGKMRVVRDVTNEIPYHDEHEPYALTR